MAELNCKFSGLAEFNKFKDNGGIAFLSSFTDGNFTATDVKECAGKPGKKGYFTMTIEDSTGKKTPNVFVSKYAMYVFVTGNTDAPAGVTGEITYKVSEVFKFVNESGRMLKDETEEAAPAKANTGKK